MARMVATTSTRPLVSRKARSGPARLALEQGKGHVAAEDPPPLAGDALGERAGQGGDAGDRRDAERDAGEEDAEALQASAQLAQGEAQQERQAGAGGRPSLRRGGKGAVHEGDP